MKTKDTYPPGLLQIKIAGVPCAAEYRGTKNALCLICGQECQCHAFNIIHDAENYPEYADYFTLYFGNAHAKQHVEVIGTVEILANNNH